jgi:hypothetical protein
MVPADLPKPKVRFDPRSALRYARAMKRDATKVIWRTVVFAGAMLGTPACSKKHPQTTPQNTAKPTEPATPTTATDTKPDQGTTAPTGEDPCAGRIRGADDDGGGGVGRGFVLS